MADSKISALTAATELGVADEMVVASAGATKKITGANLRDRAPLTAWAPTGALAQTCDPGTISGTGMALPASGRTGMTKIWLPKGITITSITFFSHSQAAVNPTHQIFGIYDDDAGTTSATPRALLRGTSDDTSAAWAADTAKTLNLTSTYLTTRSGLFYLACLVCVGTTMPTLLGTTANWRGGYTAVILPHGQGSDTGLTALANPSGAVTGYVNQAPYAYVS